MSRYIKFFLKGLFSLAIFFGLLSIPRVIKIKNIVCETPLGECSAGTQELLKKYQGKNYYLAKKGINNTLKGNKDIADYKISFVPFTKVQVVVNERKTKFTLQKKDSSDRIYIDRDGFVISGKSEDAQLVLLTEEDLPNMGTKVSEKTFFALNLLADSSLAFQVSTGIIDNDSLLIELPSGVRVIFPLEGDRDVLIGSLILVQDELYSSDSPKDKELKSNIKTIDMRFKNPVLRKS